MLIKIISTYILFRQGTIFRNLMIVFTIGGSTVLDELKINNISLENLMSVKHRIYEYSYLKQQSIIAFKIYFYYLYKYNV